MRGLQKSNRVSWASDVNLCQVRLFLSDESPSQAGLGTQDHLQAKTSWMSPPTGIGYDDNLPPGFEGALPANLLRNKLSQIPLIKWRCPPRVVLDNTWQVVAGEESKEVEIQKQREMRVLEAVYPRPSAIPPNPSVPMGTEDSPCNDLNAPLIPITPIEDEDAAATAEDTPLDWMAQSTIPMSSQSPLLAPVLPPASQGSTTNYQNPSSNGNAAAGVFPGVEPDVAAAAYAAFTAIMTRNDQGNLIDQDLLIKILSDQNMIEKLITDHKGATNPQTLPMIRPPGIVLSEPPPVQITRAEVSAPPSLASAPSGGLFYTPPNRVGLVPSPRPPPAEVVLPVPSPLAGALVARDINYYKSLIQQHGGERPDNLPQLGRVNQESINNPKPRDLKPKIMKPCIYFNSSRGCRHGANCSYQHDASSQQQASSMPEVQSAKRMKLDRELTGT
ncbi:Zinc finger CCCH domain-containing protein [Actinidia chinensis var. chinensis]|uniref:Zinc finger CCCH domain-containing protein n=1 Tax=Actinidia chinensis var. chinensis TaxID=1590841 RepID=A0A2R6PZN4_ACTCC|nr:Zinc finger CCCH domain-containing protein [Actinidia chinensis var. chinensis]